MEIFEQIEKDGRRVFSKLTAQGIRFELTAANSLRIDAPTSRKQFELIRLWKAQIIEQISPKCSNCNLSMRIIENGRLWFCPLGCASRKADISKPGLPDKNGLKAICEAKI